MVMLLVVELLRWWYTDGLRQRVRQIANQLGGTIDYFSMDLLLKTLFSPFRQISAGSVDGPLEVKLRALVDKLFSRVIGAFIRLILLVIGIVSILLLTVIGGLLLIMWVLVPLLPIIGLVLSVKGPAL